MNSVRLKDNIHWIGVEDPDLKVFDIIMNTKEGTTYNSYLIDDEKVAIVDSVKDGFFDKFISNIKGIIGDRKVDYIIVQHTELDHSGSARRLLELYPDATIIGSKAAIMYLKDIINGEFKSMEAPQELSLGNTKLKFIMAPNLHWPDTMFTYVENKELIFTCDFLGSHYCPKNGDITDNNVDYYDEMKYYFDVIMGPFKKFVIAGLDKIKDLKFDMVATSHGPVHIDDISKYMDLYREWAKLEEAKEKNVQIFYVSAYGNTENVAEFMAEKINAKGIKAEAHEITSMNMNDIIALVEGSTGVLFGSPTINQDAVKPVWDVLSLVCAITNRGKAAGAFGSYGWSGEGVQMLTDRLKSLKFKVVESGFKFKFVPNQDELKKADEFVDKFLSLM